MKVTVFNFVVSFLISFSILKSQKSFSCIYRILLLETYEPNPNDLEYIISYNSSVPMQFIISIDFHENT